jgi:hypothetical protein
VVRLYRAYGTSNPVLRSLGHVREPDRRRDVAAPHLAACLRILRHAAAPLASIDVFLAGTGWEYPDVRTALGLLVKRGLVRRTGRGNHKRYIAVNT